MPSGSVSRHRFRCYSHVASSSPSVSATMIQKARRMIDFKLPTELVELRDRVQTFIIDKVVPYENDRRQTAQGASEPLRRELVGLAREAGLLSPPPPKEYRGPGPGPPPPGVVFDGPRP